MIGRSSSQYIGPGATTVPCSMLAAAGEGDPYSGGCGGGEAVPGVSPMTISPLSSLSSVIPARDGGPDVSVQPSDQSSTTSVSQTSSEPEDDTTSRSGMESGNCEHGHAGDRSRRIGSSSQVSQSERESSSSSDAVLQYGQWMVRPRPKLGVPTSKNSCATDEELDLSVGPTSDVQASDECPGRGRSDLL